MNRRYLSIIVFSVILISALIGIIYAYSLFNKNEEEPDQDIFEELDERVEEILSDTESGNSSNESIDWQEDYTQRVDLDIMSFSIPEGTVYDKRGEGLVLIEINSSKLNSIKIDAVPGANEIINDLDSCREFGRNYFVFDEELAQVSIDPILGRSACRVTQISESSPQPMQDVIILDNEDESKNFYARVTVNTDIELTETFEGIADKLIEQMEINR